MPDFLICFRKSRRSRSQSPGAVTLLPVEWDEGGQLQATFRSNTVGGLRGKPPAPATQGRCQQQEASAHPIHHPPRSSRKRSGGKRGERKCQSIHQSPTFLWLLGQELSLSILDPPPGAGGRAVHLVMILDFLFSFYPGGFGICSLTLDVYTCILHSFLSLLTAPCSPLPLSSSPSSFSSSILSPLTSFFSFLGLIWRVW